jgi:hypothetical protein
MQLYDTFTDSSTHSGNLFAGVANAGMSNNMASYMMEQKTFHSVGSCVAVKRQYHQEIYICAAPSRDTIYQTVKQFEETGPELTDGSVTSHCLPQHDE